MNDQGKEVAITVAPNFFEDIGLSLYKAHPAVIAVRELLQNAVDACRRMGLPPNQWKIFVEVRDNLTETTIVVEDNGIGMTESQFYDDFLHAGGHKSEEVSDTRQTGGFGIAKLVIMGTPYFKVESRDHCLEKVNGKLVIRPNGHRQGTKVTMTTRALDWEGSLEDCVAMVSLSDVEGVFLDVWRNGVCLVGEDSEGQYVESNTCRGKTTPYKHNHTGDWKANTCPEIKNGQVKTYGYAAVRYNGLVQFFDTRNWIVGMNCIIDVTTRARPHDPIYPFTNSREAIRSEWGYQVHNFIYERKTDSETTRSIEAKAKEKKTKDKIYMGKPHVGLLGKKIEIPEDVDEELLISAIVQSLSEKNNNDKNAQVFSTEFDNFAYGLFEWKGKENGDMKLALAWGKIVAMCTDETFAVALTGDKYVEASRRTCHAVPFYAINPDNCWKTVKDNGIGDWLELAAYLWHLACHEVAHKNQSIHNERFSQAMGTTSARSANGFIGVIADKPDVLKALISDWWRYREAKNDRR
jgi:anti-sigma regulatory factor (Ser/Thr protein kinase)